MIPPSNAGVPTPLMPPLMFWKEKPLLDWLGNVMPTLALPLVPNWPVGSCGKPVFQSVRVKPTRAELIRFGENVCTQLAPTTFVGNRFSLGNSMGSTAVDPSYAVDME